MVGILTILLAALVLTFHNIIVRVLFSHHLAFGVVALGGYVQPTLPNSFLLMFMRMVFVVPFIAIVSPKLYPNTTTELQQLVRPERRRTLAQALGCGVLMFGSIAMLYTSIGLIPTGIALTLFFSYPVFTALFAWRLSGDRPTWFCWGVMGIILVGSVLTVPQSSSVEGNYSIAIGIVASVASGITYALYSVIAQKSFEYLHPVPFTWISFAITLLFSGVGLLFYPLPSAQLAWTPLWIGGLFSGLFSFAGHTLNNLGIRMVGATAASLIGSSSPAITAIVAWVVIGETLHPIQVIGIVIVTLGITLLSGNGALMKRSHAN